MPPSSRFCVPSRQSVGAFALAGGDCAGADAFDSVEAGAGSAESLFESPLAAVSEDLAGASEAGSLVFLA